MKYSSISLQGRRTNNEDAIFTRFEAGHVPVAAVSDGMGGHAAGEVASGICVSVLNEATLSSDLVPQDVLMDAICEANKRVLSAAEADSSKEGMGATMVAAVFYSDHLITANVGDSRLYLFSEGNLRQITYDHSYVQELVRMGYLTPEKARVHPRRNLITRCIGSPSCEPDVFYTRWRPMDMALLCSDGLSGPLTDEHIARRMTEISDIDLLCRQLAEDALKAGGTDNISLVIVRNEGGDCL